MKNRKLIKEAGISYFEIFLLVLSIFAFSYIVYETSKELETVRAENYTKGKIIVVFYSNVTKKDSESIIKSYNLTIEKYLKPSNSVVVNVPEGEEQKWVNILEQDDKVRYAELYLQEDKKDDKKKNETLSWNCCPETKEGAICMDADSVSCQDYCAVDCVQGKCSNFSDCELGCCYDNNEGLCTPNSPKGRCEQQGGNWSEETNCNIPECQLGCCVLGFGTIFATEKRCEKLSNFYGDLFDFKSEIKTEIECLVLANEQERGACAIEAGGGRGCKFTTKQECLRLQGNFNKDSLCTNSQLNTTCIKTKETTCIEGKDGVYFKDSCGNIANIYDASKVDNAEYWNRIYNKNESCSDGKGNINSKTCGNCERFLGSRCESNVNVSENPEYGNYICKDLNCENAPYVVDASGKILKSKDRVNGESWCIYDSYIGEGKDVVGSRHFKYYCLDGEVKIEGCSDYRQEICVESDEEEISQAVCRVNRWRECIEYNNLGEKEGDKIDYKPVINACKNNSDCYIKEFDFGKKYHFYQCLPNYPTGFELQSDRGKKLAKVVCGMANFDCVKVEVKKISGWECVAGCDCTSQKYTQQMNDWCISLGDCGGYVNIVGKMNEGYSIDKAPKIDLNQYKKYVNPVEGQKAEPGNFSEMIMGMLGGEYKSEKLNIFLAGIIGLVGFGVAAYAQKAVEEEVGLGIAQETLPHLVSGFKSFNPTTFLKGFISPNFWAPALASIAGSIAGYYVAKAFGLSDSAAKIVAFIGGAAGAYSVGIIVTSGFVGCFDAVTCTIALIILIVLIIIAIILKLLGIGDVRETHVRFTCYPWISPKGGIDCEKCGSDLKECSRYRCEKLGRACEFVNEGTGQGRCVKVGTNKSSIYPWYEILSSGFRYQNVEENGFKIRQENGECIQTNSYLIFGIVTNESTQCKYDIEDKNYNEMQNYFGQDNLLDTNHSMPFTSPSIEAIAQEFNLTYEYVADKIKNITFYVKCEDAEGNVNIQPYLIDICIKPGLDKTAPIILGAIPPSESYVKLNATEQGVYLFINEPAECKYSTQNKNYSLMESNMSCLTGLQGVGLNGWECNASLDLIKNTTFYFRCKDQPWLTGANESSRNTNQESFVYSLQKSSNELKIDRIEPNGTIVAGVEPFSVTLKAYTSGGAEDGKAVCSFRFSSEGSGIEFLESNDKIHEQQFPYMFSGTRIIYVKCEDIAGNFAEGQTTFVLDLDTKAPKIIRVYNSGMLKIITDEDAECVYSNENCNFVWENATKMTGLLREHEASWEDDLTYYIKCKDLWNNKGNCFIVKTIQ